MTGGMWLERGPRVENAAGARIEGLGLVGAGEVVRKRFWLGVQANGHGLRRITICSREREDPLGAPAHSYHQVGSDSRLLLSELAARGVLSPRALWVVATPTQYHVHYALQLAGRCRVAIEKPLATSSGEAKRLLPFAREGSEVYPIDHKLFNAPMLSFVDRCRRDPSLLRCVRHVEGRFFETSGFSHGRAQEDCIADCQHHLLSAMTVAFKRPGERLRVAIDRAQVSFHEPDPEGRYARPSVPTASRLRGRVELDGQEVSFDLQQGKGLPHSEKSLSFLDGRGRPVDRAEMNESGWHAHARVLGELLKPHPDMRFSLADAIMVMGVIDRSRAIATEEAPFCFGGIPHFLPSL